MSRKKEMKQLILSHQRRLQKLKEQQALKGASIDPSIPIEIEDIEQKIKTLQDELKALENNDDPSPQSPLEPITSIFLSYDWEDRPDVRLLVDTLRSRGVKIAWDQDWPFWEDRSQKLEDAIGQADVFVLYSTSHSQHSRWVKEEIVVAEQAQKQIIVLDRMTDTRCDLVTDKVGVDLTHVRQVEVVEVIITTLNPSLHQFKAQNKRDERSVQELLDDALKANLDIPSDTIADKIFVSPEACRLVEKAYELAKPNLPASNLQRLRATLEYGRLRRFQGEWTDAEEVLQRGKDFAQRAKNELYPVFCLELGSLQFERGIVGGQYWVETALNEFQKRGITFSLIKTLRQLGNLLREQGDWEEAERYLTAAEYMAEYLKDAENMGTETISKIARYLLWIDCVRERAGLFAQQGNADEVVKQAENSLKTAEETAFHHSEYLCGLILYQLGRVYLINKRDVKTALGYLEKSIGILHKYDNPVRLSFLFDALGKALTRQHPQSDFETAEKYLEKAKRVRDRCGHEYFSAYTLLSIGDLHRAKGDTEFAIEKYKEARDTLNKLDKIRDLGIAWFKLGRSYAQLSDHQEQARESLEEAERQFRKIKLGDRIRDTKFELFKLRHPDYDLRNMRLDELLDKGKAENYDFVLNEIGEYRFHSWIKKRARIPDASVFNSGLYDLIDVNIGDDAAVIGVPGSDNYEIILTTDAAPGSICRSPEVHMGQYAAKFSVVHSISDILAMGGTPIAVLLNLYLARGATLDYAMAVIKTVIKEADKYSVALIGGDLKERKEQSIGCVGVGVVEKKKYIRRNGAKPGHIVAITLAHMQNEPPGVVRKIGCRWAQEIVEYRKLAEIEPYNGLYDKNWKRDLLFLSHKEMIAGSRTGYIRSAIDTSDGFLSCLEILGRESKVGFVLEEALIEEIIDDRVKKIAEALALRPAQFLFNAGHDWEIVLTVQEDEFESLRNEFRKAGGDLARLGTVCEITDLIDPNEEIDPKKSPPPKPLEQGIAMISSVAGKKLWIPFYTDEKFVRRAYEERPMDWEDLKFYLAGRRELA